MNWKTMTFTDVKNEWILKTELKKCPFCGNKPDVILNDSWGAPFIYNIECRNNKCEVQSSVWSYSEQATREIWNAIPERKTENE